MRSARRPGRKKAKAGSGGAAAGADPVSRLHVWLVSICLAISALYELIEWWVALLSGEAAEAFLGTQGYVWDTQSDMFLAFPGAIAALLVFSALHDRQIGRLSV